MDYARYIELYRQGKFQEAVEYKATQIPTRLIKYYGLNENEIINKSKMEYLKEQKIYLSSFQDSTIRLKESFLDLIVLNWRTTDGIRIW